MAKQAIMVKSVLTILQGWIFITAIFHFTLNVTEAQTLKYFDGMSESEFVSYFKQNGLSYSIEGVWLITREMEYKLVSNGKVISSTKGTAKMKESFVRIGDHIGWLQTSDLDSEALFTEQPSCFFRPTNNTNIYLLICNSSPTRTAYSSEVIVRDDLIEYEYRLESPANQPGVYEQVTLYKSRGVRIAPTDHDLVKGLYGQGSKLSIPLKTIGGMHYTTLELGGKTANYIIDSGASFLTITPEMERHLKNLGVLRDSDYRGIIELELADHSIHQVTRVILPALKIGNQVISNVEAVVSDGPLLLGRSLINKFKSWNIDNSRNILTIEGY